MSTPGFVQSVLERLPMLKPVQRLWWDVLVLVAVIGCAFEIPFGLLVGYADPDIEFAFDLVFLLVFGIDMILNCITIRSESFGGFWGWRVVMGFFTPRLSPLEVQLAAGGQPRLLTTQPGVAGGYARSGWFFIDLVATTRGHGFSVPSPFSACRAWPDSCAWPDC